MSEEPIFSDPHIRIEFLARLNRVAPVMPHYEAVLEAMYRRVVTPGQCVYDIGCHSGRHARSFLDLVGPSGQVVGFEPIPEMAGKLRLLADARPNFTVFETAVSNRTGTAAFIVARGTPEESGLIERQFNHPDLADPHAIEVSVNQLDSFVCEQGLRDPDYVKIDVEGAEMDVLEGACEILARARPLLSVEYGAPSYAPYGNKPGDLFEFAHLKGFVMFDLFGYRLPTIESWLAECDRGLWDWFMVPAERADEIEAAWR
jgi:FkbM family methyltransferase